MKLLYRHLLGQSMRYFLLCMALGTGIYLLTDLFDRLDNFIEAGLGVGTLGLYFLVKTPLIVSQIMPAVFLVASIVMLSLMARNRELLALRAGGVSFSKLLVFFLIYGVVMSVVELGFSQGLAVVGEQKAERIWKEQVRKNQLDKRTLYKVWFMEGSRVVEIREAYPFQHAGADISVYDLAPDELSMERIIHAERFSEGEGEWTLINAEIMDPKTYVVERRGNMTIPMEQKLSSFVAVDPDSDPSSLSMFQLSDVMRRLERSGSNIEALRTLWHMKVAYAFSLLIMGLLALTLISMRENIYFNVAVALVATFAYYATFVVGVSMGELGILPPILAAWLGNILFAALALSRLLWYIRPRMARPGRLSAS